MGQRIMTCLLAICMLSLVSTAQAQDGGLEPAKRLYLEGRFAEAVRALRTVVTALEQERNTRSRDGALADAYLHLGLAYVALDDLPTAKDAFKNVLRLVPGYRLDSERYAPKVITVFGQARLAVDALAPELRPASAEKVGTARRWRLRLEGGARTFARVYTRGTPRPEFTQDQLESCYALALRSHPRGGGGAVALGLDRRAGNGVEARFAWANASDATAAPLAVDVTKGLVLTPPEPDGSEDLHVRVLDVLWSRRMVERPGLSLRFELGYRYAQTHQSARDLLKERRCLGKIACPYTSCERCLYSSCADDPNQAFCSAPFPVIRVIRRDMRSRTAAMDDHGVRAGADLALRLHSRWHLVAGLGATIATRRERTRVDWLYKESPETSEPLEHWYELSTVHEQHIAFDISAGLRVDVGPRVSARLDYRLHDLGPESRAATGGRLLTGGVALAVAYSFGR
jgi:hypothetical protein